MAYATCSSVFAIAAPHNEATYSDSLTILRFLDTDSGSTTCDMLLQLASQDTLLLEVEIYGISSCPLMALSPGYMRWNSSVMI